MAIKELPLVGTVTAADDIPLASAGLGSDARVTLTALVTYIQTVLDIQIESAQTYSALTDKASIDLPAVNVPLAAALLNLQTAINTHTTALGSKQDADADLTAIAALVSAANQLPYATGLNAWAMATLTAAGRALIAGADAAAQRATLALDQVNNTSDATKNAATVSLTNKTIDGASNTITNLAASVIASGTVAPARLGSGTASSSTVLFGDSVFRSLPGGGDALVANGLSQFAAGATSSAQMRTLISDESGTGPLLFGTGPAISGAVLTAPALGTPASGTLTNCTGLPVLGGGTGLASATAYAPLFGGTTSTGAFQSGTVGTSGQVLTSNGAGALPTFQAAAGGATTLAALTDRTTYDLPTNNTPLATALAAKITALAPVTLGSGTTAITHSAHANRALYVNQAGATTMAFSPTGTSGAVNGDVYTIRNVGAGTATLTGVTAATGCDLTIETNGVAEVEYVGATDTHYGGVLNVTGGGGGFTPTTYIAGCVVNKGSGNTLNISAGSAYIPASTAVVVFSAVTNGSAGTLGASQKNQVYAKSDGTYEVVNNAEPPSTAYLGTARQGGTGGNRRWVGSFLTDGSSNILDRVASECEAGLVQVVFQADINTGAPYRVLSGGTDAAFTAVSLAGIVPRYAAVAVKLNVYAAAVAGGLIEFSTDGTNSNAGSFTVPLGVTGGYLSVNDSALIERSTPQLYYRTSTTVYLDVESYKVAR